MTATTPRRARERLGIAFGDERRMRRQCPAGLRERNPDAEDHHLIDALRDPLAEDPIEVPGAGRLVLLLDDLPQEERERARGILEATISSASDLPPDLQDQVRRSFERVTGRKIRLSQTIDPSLIGGMVTRIGSTVYDGSVRTQLQNLRRRMVEE